MPEEEKTILEQAKDSVTNVSQKIVDIKDDMMSEEQNAIMDEFKEASIDRTRQIMGEINNSMTLISKSGYECKNISISAGIPPSLSLSFHYKKNIDEKEQSFSA